MDSRRTSPQFRQLLAIDPQRHESAEGRNGKQRSNQSPLLFQSAAENNLTRLVRNSADQFRKHNRAPENRMKTKPILITKRDRERYLKVPVYLPRELLEVAKKRPKKKSAKSQ